MTDLGFLHWGLSSAVKSPSTHPQQVSVLTDRKVNVTLYGVKLCKPKLQWWYRYRRAFQGKKGNEEVEKTSSMTATDTEQFRE